MKITQSNLALFVAAAITLTSCSPAGFQSNSKSTQDNSSLGTDGIIIPPGQTLNDTVAKLDLQGQVDSQNSSFGKALTFDFDKVRGEFIIMLPMPSGVLFNPMGSFSKYPDITFYSLFDAEGRMKFAVRIPVKYILKGVSTLPAASLPNGDPLPAMPSGYGELPSLALNFPQHNNTQISLYLGVNAIGLYVTLPTNAALPIGFTLPVRNKDKSKTFGYLSYVPAKNSFAPGLFVSTLIPAAVSRILEDYFKL